MTVPYKAQYDNQVKWFLYAYNSGLNPNIGLVYDNLTYSNCEGSFWLACSQMTLL